jgi:hypothetical protein
MIKVGKNIGNRRKFNPKKFGTMAAHITTDAPNMKETNEFASKALQ